MGEQSMKAKENRKLRLVQCRTMSRLCMRRLFEFAHTALSDARCDGLSARARFASAYDAARASATALCGAMSENVTFGELGDLKAFERVAEVLELSTEFRSVTQKFVRLHRIEARLFYEGETAIYEYHVSAALKWAEQFYQAVNAHARTSRFQ
jgi:hypothetical protein